MENKDEEYDEYIEDKCIKKIEHKIRNFRRLDQSELDKIKQMTKRQIIKFIIIYNDATETLMDMVSG